MIREDEINIRSSDGGNNIEAVDFSYDSKNLNDYNYFQNLNKQCKNDSDKLFFVSDHAKLKKYREKHGSILHLSVDDEDEIVPEVFEDKNFGQLILEAKKAIYSKEQQILDKLEAMKKPVIKLKSKVKKPSK